MAEMNTATRALPEWAAFERDYERILCRHIREPSERTRFDAENLGKRMVAARLGPDALIGMHAAALLNCLSRNSDGVTREKLALEVLLEAMVAFAMEYCRLAESRRQEEERLATHSRMLEGLNRDLMDVHRELSEEHESLQQSHEELDKLSQQKSDLLATVTHEIRTPLTSVLGYGEFLEEGTYGELNPEQADVLHRMMQGGRDVLALVNRILDLSRLEAGRLHLDSQALPLQEVVAQAVETIKAQALRKHIALDTSGVPADLPPVWGDSLRVLEILVNLLGNAVKFTPEGGRIAIGAAPRHGEIEVRVSDTGPGIDPEQQAILFQKYAQNHNGSRRYGGSGLGLALCKELVTLHGGRIWIESEPGKGATFRFTLARYVDQDHKL